MTPDQEMKGCCPELGTDDGSLPSNTIQAEEPQPNDSVSKERRGQSPRSFASKAAKLQVCLQLVVHMSNCTTRDCRLSGCGRLKMVAQHSLVCKTKGCLICEQFEKLNITHTRFCKTEGCPVPSCKISKLRLQQQVLAARKKLQERNNGNPPTTTHKSKAPEKLQKTCHSLRYQLLTMQTRAKKNEKQR
ncbi:histone lysine acetyltransferase CREBBP-like [Neocloeon triangulifer]|uniref:histone lysine acetyltransferase CREBBP-like n=1 Tax=Neocloeon triangulifer TaxID=2078957 RepID=UPI00286EC0C3|nr:histone lysine acetyltransferase CREBBP-like [Neocloeon triangulifer]